MSRNFKLEQLEKDLVEQAYDTKTTPVDMLNAAQKALSESHNDTWRHKMLAYHLGGCTGYPLDDYTMTQIEKDMGQLDGIKLTRTIIKYTSKYDPAISVSIFEQNWFAGYGFEGTTKPGVFVGLCDGDY